MTIRSLLSPVFSLLLLLSGADLLFADNSAPPDPLSPTFETPLQNAVKGAYRQNATGKKNKMPNDGPEGRKDKCAAAIAAESDKQIALFCDDVGALSYDTIIAPTEFTNPAGKVMGKRMVTKTKLHYTSPKQKGRAGDPQADKWEEKLQNFERKREWLPGPAVDSNAGGLSRSYGSSFVPESDGNDDKDCVDFLTGEHHEQSACFDSEGKLLRTLSVDPSKPGACVHVNGSVFFGISNDGIDDDCWDENNILKTTLVELIDEDGPEEIDNDGDGKVNEDPPGNGNEDNDCIARDGTILPCGGQGPYGEDLQPLIDEDGPDNIDNDGDGKFNEDPPPAHDSSDSSNSDCARFYKRLGMTPTADDLDKTKPCDIGRALAKYANDNATAHGHKKLFKVNDDGVYDPNLTDGVEPGKEERDIEITESFGVKCHNGTTYVDGVCIPDDELANAGAQKLALLGMIGGPVKFNAGDPPDIAKIAMMGFTFSPPVIEWGYKVREEACVLGICVEIFYARVGYEFDLALGLRLPVEVQIPGMPTSVLAGNESTIETQIVPLDFTTTQFEQFCHQHNLDSKWYIGGGGGLTACRRFGFTDFLDAMVPDSLLPADKKDGDEMVARYAIFAGIQVRVLGISLINWGIDSSADIPAACTMKHIIDILKSPGDIPATDITAFVSAIMGFGSSSSEGVSRVIAFLKDKGSACGTFETPFGKKDDGSIRPFPFSGSYDIRADCAEAVARGEVITIGGKPRPLCTNIILGVSGASLGVGIGLEAKAGSNLVRSDWTTAQDASGSGTVKWWKASNESEPKVGLTFLPDNYDGADFHDTAKINLAKFIYYLNQIEIALKANLQFGGILSVIPDIGSFPIYRFTISGGDTFGLPIPQHPGTGAVTIDVPVENYGLKVNLKPETTTPSLLLNADTLRIVPGQFGAFLSEVRNLGSFDGDFDNFRIELSNRSGQAPGSETFLIDPNNDHDCRATATGPCEFRGDRWDGLGDACYLDSGAVRPDRIECIDEDPPSTVLGLSRAERDDDKDGLPDEDPPDFWATSPAPDLFASQSITGISPYTWTATPSSGTAPAAGQSLRIAVSPFRHPLTSPGVYPIRVTADSIEAKANKMAENDPSSHKRFNASDLSFIKIESFFEPQVVVLPNTDSGKAGVLKTFTVEGTNGGNTADFMSVNVAFVDFNQAKCTLTTLGRLAAGSDPNCAYRAVPTVIPQAWTTVSTVAHFFPEAQPGKLDPLASATDSFTISPPRTWAGMDDTTYRFTVTTVSQVDSDVPPATRRFTATHKVIATKESMTRYIGLEIDELIATVNAAQASGLKVGGLGPIAVKPMQMSNDRALEAVLAGDFKKASGNQATTTKLVEAYVHALDGGGKDLPPALFNDLHARTAAMLADLARAETCMVPSAP